MDALQVNVPKTFGQQLELSSANIAHAVDTGCNWVLVSRLIELCNPFESPPWHGISELSMDRVRQAIEDNMFLMQPYSSGQSDMKNWSVEDHIQRIAWLVVRGWDDHIGVDVGVPGFNCYVDWPVVDGNHRLAAAMIRGDKYILASVSGCCDHSYALLGV